MTEAVTSSLTMQDGTRLHVVDYHPAAPASGSVLILHGLGEHAGRYRHVAEFFTARAYAVRTYDHRGHGRSGGPRGDVPDNDALLADAHAVMADWRTQPGTPASAPLLLGHSMGGLLAAHMATQMATQTAAQMATPMQTTTPANPPLCGLVLSSPALALPLNAAQMLLLKTLTAVSPGFAVSNGLKQRYLSHDPAVIAAYQSDPLVHDRISPRLLNAMLAAIASTHQRASALTIPVLLLVSGHDRLVDAQGSRDFHAQLPAASARLIEYPSLYHELFNEIDAAQVFGDLDDWLSALRERTAA